MAATRIVDDYWRPVFLYDNREDICKGSARSIKGVDITAVMSSAGHLFSKFGGHKAAGGFSFPKENEQALHDAMLEYVEQIKQAEPSLWESKIHYDCSLTADLQNLRLFEQLDDLRPFGLGFEEPKFVITGKVVDTRYYRDRVTNKETHTAVRLEVAAGQVMRVMLFNEVCREIEDAPAVSFVVTAPQE